MDQTFFALFCETVKIEIYCNFGKDLSSPQCSKLKLMFAPLPFNINQENPPKMDLKTKQYASDKTNTRV